MIRKLLFPVVLLIVIISVSACTEDEFADWKLMNESWLAKHSTDTLFQHTESGLCYKVIHQGYMRHPTSSSNIVVKYTGTLINGNEFDSDSIDTNLASRIAGWIEGIPKMQVGGRYIFYIPYDLGYGEDGSRDNIPPYSTLIFDVTLIDSDDQLHQ
ncbi:MAG: FKBP-type peptidyl-prolyl cis-trans isomerase [Paludibacter sp.]|nr:FKBP-type peptidyl-prolyl cis-trans isomerase [Paludibacter sp.]